MTRGRKPKPTALKALAGFPGKRAVNHAEPKFPAPAEVPPPPNFLNKRAKAEWTRVAGELLAAGILTTIDTAALASYCSWWALFAQASEELENSGLVQTADSGYESPSAWVSLKKQASEQMHKFMTEFGLTPASRGRIKVMPPEEKDPFEEFLGDAVIGRVGA